MLFKKGMRAIRELSDFWIDLYSQSETNAKKSIEAECHFLKQQRIGFDHSKKYKAGDFCWIQYGNNSEPELSYEHLGIIFMVKGHMIYTLPITSKKEHNPKHNSAYHPTENPTGNLEFVLLKQSDFHFLLHDSVVKTSEPKVVSQKRVKNKIGHKDLSDPLMNNILDIAHRYLFGSYDYKINQIIKENSLLRMRLELANLPNEIDNIEKIQQYPFSSELTAVIELNDNQISVTIKDQFGQFETCNIQIITD